MVTPGSPTATVDPVEPSTGAPAPSEEDVIGILRGVIDPELGSDIVDLGMVRSVAIEPDGTVGVTVALTTSGCPLRAQIQRDVRDRVGSLPGVRAVTITWSELTQEEKRATMSRARANVAKHATPTAIPGSARVLMIASGKGGVGKSSVTVNLAAALAAMGMRIGLIDADIWGYSVPRMLGVGDRLGGDQASGKIRPHEVEIGTGVIQVVSMGLLVDAEETALMWRGLMLSRAVQHFLEDVDWSDDLDYVLIDMPPGTGDVQMGLARRLPRAEMIVVTTPSRSAQKVAVRAVNMGRQNHLRILGVIENMSVFVGPDGEEFAIFGSGGGAALAAEASTPLLARIPIESAVAAGGDSGTPIALGTGPAAESYRDLARRIVEEIAPRVEMSGCSVRALAAKAGILRTPGATH